MNLRPNQFFWATFPEFVLKWTKCVCVFVAYNLLGKWASKSKIKRGFEDHIKSFSAVYILTLWLSYSLHKCLDQSVCDRERSTVSSFNLQGRISISPNVFDRLLNLVSLDRSVVQLLNAAIHDAIVVMTCTFPIGYCAYLISYFCNVRRLDFINCRYLLIFSNLDVIRYLNFFASLSRLRNFYVRVIFLLRCWNFLIAAPVYHCLVITIGLTFNKVEKIFCKIIKYINLNKNKPILRVINHIMPHMNLIMQSVAG